VSTNYICDPTKTLTFSALISNLKTEPKVFDPEDVDAGSINPDIQLGKLVGEKFTPVSLDAAYNKKGDYVLSAGDSCMHLGFTEDADPKLCIATVYRGGKGEQLEGLESWLLNRGAVTYNEDVESNAYDTCADEWKKLFKKTKQKSPFVTIDLL
jgi:hypothetical protein